MTLDEAEDGAEVTHVAAALAGADDVADDRLGADHEPACAHPLERPEADQLGHRLRQPGQRRPDRKITIAAWKSFFRP